MQPTNITQSDYQQFCQFLETRCGIVLGDNKQYLVRSRLNPLLKQSGMSDFGVLIKQVISGRDSALMTKVVDAMTTNETLWFRDSYPFMLLAEQLLPQFESLNRPLKIWSAACSSGQEPYSIAMTVNEYRRRKPGSFRQGVQIVATDISSKVLAQCKTGEYDDLSLARGLSAERRQRFFASLPNGNSRINSDIRDMVSFRPLNLLESYLGLGKFDIVFCRNVLIYFFCRE